MESKSVIETGNLKNPSAVPDCLVSAARYASADGDRDARLRVHLESGDYFSFLATIFGFVEDICVEHERKSYATAPMTSDAFQKLRSDLIYLQHHYHISKNKTSVPDALPDRTAVCNHTLRQTQ